MSTGTFGALPGTARDTALVNNPLGPVDLETLERTEQSRELGHYLEAAAPGILYGLFQRYLKSNPTGRVFDQRYGQVCIRILIRLVQVVICSNSDTFEYIMANLHTAATNTGISILLAKHTTKLMGAKGTDSTESFTTASSLLGEKNTILSHENISELLNALWRDRKSFFVLCKNGSLPGVLSLLYMIWFDVSGVKGKSYPPLMARLRDLLYRCYLATSTKERNIIRILCIQMYMIHDGHDDESEPFDLEDSRSVVHAYSQCIMFPVDPDPKSGMRLDMYRYLLEFVSDVTGAPLHEEFPLLARAATERLWMAFDTETVELLLPPDDPRSQILYYAGDLIYAVIELFQRLPKGKPQRPFAEALRQGDWTDILARYMLLLFRRPKIISFPTYTFNNIPKLATLLAEFGPVAYEVFADTRADWVKICNHLRMLLGMRRSGDSTLPYIHKVIEEWLRWGKAIGAGGWIFLETDCTYPRCTGGLSTRICGRCGVARYCSPRCQNADWLSPCSDSHRLSCQPNGEIED